MFGFTIKEAAAGYSTLHCVLFRPDRLPRKICRERIFVKCRSFEFSGYFGK